MFHVPSRILFPPRSSSLTSPFRQPFFPSHLPPRPRTASSLGDFVKGVVDAVISDKPPSRNHVARVSPKSAAGSKEIRSKGDEYRWKGHPAQHPAQIQSTSNIPSSSQPPPSNPSSTSTPHSSVRMKPRLKSARPTHSKSTHLARTSAPATSSNVLKGRIRSQQRVHQNGWRMSSNGTIERVDMARAKKMNEKPPISPKISVSIKDLNPSSSVSALSSNLSPSSALSTSRVGLGIHRIKSPLFRRRSEVYGSTTGVSKFSVDLEEDYPNLASTKFSKPSTFGDTSRPSPLPSSPELSLHPSKRPSIQAPIDSASCLSKDEVKERTPVPVKTLQVNLGPYKSITTTLSPHSSQPIPPLASAPTSDPISVSHDTHTDIDVDSYDFSWLEEEEQYQALLEAESFYHPRQLHSLPWFLSPSLSNLSYYHYPHSSISRRAALQTIENVRSTNLRSIRAKLDLCRNPSSEILENRLRFDEARGRERKELLRRLEGKEDLIEEQSWIVWTSAQYSHYQLLEKFKSDVLAWTNSPNRSREEEDWLLQRLRVHSMFTRFYLSDSRQPFNLPPFPNSADQLYSSAQLYTDSTFTKTYPVAFSKISQVSPYKAYTRGGLNKLESVEKRNRKAIMKVWKEIEKIGRW